MRILLSCAAVLLSLAAFGTVRADDVAPAAPPPLRLMPAPAQVSMDGDLTGWNKDGKVGPLTFDPDSIEDYNATCYAMYDADYLYLAAVVVEPHPPYNTFPVRGVGAWNGDDVILRMSSNPARAWPLVGSPDSLKTDPDLFQGDFWLNPQKKRTYWDGYHGMGGPMLPDDQWTGTAVAVKLAADGKGYTEEIKIPWKTINPNFHPKAGDRIALSLDICMGNANPAEPARAFEIPVNGNGTDFRNPGSWGQAVFVGPSATP
jgi:hypothetical protein